MVADLGAERIVVAHALLGSVAAAAKLESQPAVVKTIAGRALEGLAPSPPPSSTVRPRSSWPTTSRPRPVHRLRSHTAPGHGMEDYLTGLRYHLEIYCPVGDDGKYLDDGRVPADLIGLTTLETVEDLEKKRTSPANIGVLKKLDATGALFAKQRHVHSYPHCWRSKTLHHF